MSRLFVRNTVAIVIGAALSLPALATTVTIGASRDATIYQNPVNNSNGAGPVLFAGTNGQDSPAVVYLILMLRGQSPLGPQLTLRN